MVPILRFLVEHCGFLFGRHGFRFVDSQAESASGAAMLILESEVLRLRFTHDRGQLLLEFQPIRGKKLDWFSLGLLSGVLLGDRNGFEVLDAAWAEFFSESIGELEIRFSDPTTSKVLVEQLRNQARLRAKALFD